jgi:hypothetical protein
MNAEESTSNPSKDHKTPVSAELLKRFANDQLIVDLPTMNLKQCGMSKPATYTGCGLLLVHADKEFELRMYVTGSESHSQKSIEDMERFLQEVQSGDVLPASEYFQFSGVDFDGLEWVCDRVAVDVYDQGHGIVITGHLRDVLRHEATGLSRAQRASASVYIFDDLRVALDRYESTQTLVDGRAVSLSTKPVFAAFKSAGLEFTVRREESERGSIVVCATSADAALPTSLEVRIEEALSYVTASSARWCLVEKRFDTKREVLMVPRRLARKSLLEEPVDSSRFGGATDFWRLFSAYLEYVLQHTDPDTYHPISSQLFHVVAGETQQLDLIALTVGVAVEGVLNVAFTDFAKPSNEFLNAREALAKRLVTVRCTNQELGRRIRGALETMKSPTSSATDKLKLLEASGVVTDTLVGNWKKLRNKSAHPNGKYDPSAQAELYAQCNSVYTMLNRLIFQAIGYQGPYSDFSKRGWPIDHFSPQSVENHSDCP